MIKTSLLPSIRLSRRFLSMALPPLGSNDFLRTEKIDFESDGSRYKVDVVIQDTLPEGSSIGTVIATGGSPGSHRDFKFIANHLQKMKIRYVGVNFSGYGDTPWNPKLRQTWTERLAYVQAVVDKLQLKENLIFLGHSMGTEPALKAAVQNKDATVAVVLVNPCGLRKHDALRPFIRIQLMYWFWCLRRFFGGVVDRIIANLYSRFFNLRLREPHNVGVCLESCVQADFAMQRPFVARFNASTMKALIAYAENDQLIEMDTTTEFLAAFKDRQGLVHQSGESSSDLAEKSAKLWNAGARVVDVNFPTDGHFVQKHRGEFIAGAISVLLANKSAQNKL